MNFSQSCVYPLKIDSYYSLKSQFLSSVKTFIAFLLNSTSDFNPNCADLLPSRTQVPNEAIFNCHVYEKNVNKNNHILLLFQLQKFGEQQLYAVLT